MIIVDYHIKKYYKKDFIIIRTNNILVNIKSIMIIKILIIENIEIDLVIIKINLIN